MKQRMMSWQQFVWEIKTSGEAVTKERWGKREREVK